MTLPGIFGFVATTLLLGCQQNIDLQQVAKNDAYWQEMLQQARSGQLPAYAAALAQTNNFALLQSAVTADQFQMVLSGAPQADSWAYAQALAESLLKQGTRTMPHLLLHGITQAAVDSQLDEVQYVEFLGHILSYMQQQLGKKFIVVLALSQLPDVQQFHSIGTDKTWTQQRFTQELIQAVKSAVVPQQGQILWLDDLPKDAAHVQLVPNVAPLQLAALSAVDMQKVLSGYKQQLENRFSMQLNGLLFDKLIRVVVAYRETGPLQLSVDVLASWAQRCADGGAINQADQQRELLVVLSGVLRTAAVAIGQSAAWVWDGTMQQFDAQLQQNPALYQQNSPVGRSSLASLPTDLYARIAKGVASVHTLLNLSRTDLSGLINYVRTNLIDIHTDTSSFITLVSVQDNVGAELTRRLINALNGLSSRLSSSSVGSFFSAELNAVQNSVDVLRGKLSPGT